MIAGCLLILSALGAWIMWGRSPSEDAPPRLLARSQFTWLHLWTSLPDRVAAADRTRDQYSNIAPQDYVKPDACAECHPDQHRMWENHPHSRMNATASSKTVFGRFDGSSIDLQGGTISMFQRNDDYWVRMDGHDIEREFRVTRTIGSRFYQFYVGRLESGAPLPALPAEHGEYPQQELVLPVGYRLKDDTWTPAYDVFLCIDHDSPQDYEFDLYDNLQPVVYYEKCAMCHTTMPEGYRMLQDVNAMALARPEAHLGLWTYLDETLTEMAPHLDTTPDLRTDRAFVDFVRGVQRAYGPERAVALGISCESCHYGGRAHAESAGKVPPRFVPCSPHLAYAGRTASDLGRKAQNINWGCSRCHSAIRDKLPGGERHKNSAEFRDARYGGCYSQLSCVHCHSPHAATGQLWPNTPDKDDHSCLTCHTQYEAPPARQAHTHHPLGSSGSRCMNCHMPHVVEGLEDIVRTHRIDSPTRTELITQAGPNACNLCHLDRSIQWTVSHLDDWYDATYDAKSLRASYGELDRPVGEVWFGHDSDYVRLTALGAVKRERAAWLLPIAADELDSGRLIHRQFAQDTIESVLDCDLTTQTGYRFWMTPEQRAEILENVREFIDTELEEAPREVVPRSHQSAD